jgi:hypothetical protein
VIKVCYIECTHPNFFNSIRQIVMGNKKMWNVQKGVQPSNIQKLHTFLLTQSKGQKANPRRKGEYIAHDVDDVVLDMILQNLKEPSITDAQLIEVASEYFDQNDPIYSRKKSVQLRLKLW